MTQHLDDVITALVASLKTIRGTASGYWTDFDGRVYDRFKSASEWEAAGYAFPVLFVVGAGDESPFKNEDHGLSDETRIRLFGWVREDSEDQLVSNARTKITKMRDDLVIFFVRNPKLGGKLTLPIRPSAYALDWGIDDKYAALGVSIGLPNRLFAANLGPQAT